MDSKTLLDYAVFQLTPTRTRCDLVVFSGKKSEKLASGLVQPFIAHLRYAKDHIPKGGYSITLRPPSKAGDTSWFTKATFQRFVRFVSSPEILERIIRIEKEILQIDSSIQSTEVLRLEGTTHRGEESSSIANVNIIRKANSFGEDHEASPRENSRVHLQRVMDTRRALLQKEQAMAYARAVVAGYEMDTIDDLLCFADAFGALRLREACVDFKELYKKKHSDDQWMDELAAVQAFPVTDLSYTGSSEIMVTGDSTNGSVTRPDSTATRTKENNGVSTEQTTPSGQPQALWANQTPPFMYNFQGPIQPIPTYYPYYPPHAGWSPTGSMVPSKTHKPSRRKGKSFDANDIGAPEPTESGTGSDSDEPTEHDNTVSSTIKKNGSNSKTVIIRNLNYITSQRNEDPKSSEDSSEDSLEASIREGVDDAIASVEKHARSKIHKNRGTPNSYAERDDENGADSYIHSYRRETSDAWDAFRNLLLIREEPDSSELSKNLPGEEKYVMKDPTVANDSVLVVAREGSDGGQGRSVDLENGEEFRSTKSVVDSYVDPTVPKEDSFVDDSFIIQSRSAVDKSYSFNRMMDMNIDTDVDVAKPGKGKPNLSGPAEPDELCMVLVRESRESSAIWAPEMDYQVEISFNEGEKKKSAGPTANGKRAVGPAAKKIGRDLSRSLSGPPVGRRKVDSGSKSKMISPAIAQKYKLMKEEEERKRMEELRIQRQKRIAERTAASGSTSTASSKKKVPVGNKSTPQKPEKNRSPKPTK